MEKSWIFWNFWNFLEVMENWKVMEFWLKMDRVLKKSWNFEIWPKSHGKVMKFTNKFLILMNRQLFKVQLMFMSNIPILPEALLTFAGKSSIGPSYVAHEPYTPCTLRALKWLPTLVISQHICDHVTLCNTPRTLRNTPVTLCNTPCCCSRVAFFVWRLDTGMLALVDCLW